MADDEYQPVTVSRRISAPAHEIFQILSSPVRHIEFDGSDMLRGAVSTAIISGAGDVFVMKMYYAKLGDYEMDNHVVEYEQDRRIGWEPVAGRGHPDAAPDSSSPARWGHRWIFQLTPDGPDETIVTEIYDCSRVPVHERLEIDNGKIWIEDMARTLERLGALCGCQEGAAMTTGPKTHTLDAPGAVLHYDVRSNDASAEPVLLLIASPMGAAGFATLAGYFTGRTVVTYDPRGAGRSKRTDGALETTPDEHADDLHRLISALDAGPVDIFASSGGAVNALALVARHPEQVRTLVAHEPAAFAELPDSAAVLAAARDINQTYHRSGFGPAMAKFIAVASYEGPLPDDFASQPAPDPAAFGLPAGDDGSRDDPLVGQNMISCTHYRYDFAALRAASTRIVLGVGAESANVVTGRAAVAVAEGLGAAPVTFPGGHDGFAGGEYGRAGAPEAFAATLREVLAD